MSRKKQSKLMQLRDVSGAAETRAEREHKMLEAHGYHKVDPLEKEADELLRKQDHDMLQAILENTQALCDGLAQLKLPSNDPDYLRRLQTSDAARAALSNRLTRLDIVPDGQKTWISVGSFPHHEAVDLARKLADHFEITDIQTHEPQI